MRFLIDASLPRIVGDVLHAHGHEAIDVRDIGLATADDMTIARHAKSGGLILITRDNDFGNIFDYPPNEYYGIVVVQTSKKGDRRVIAELVASLLMQTEILSAISGRLVIVDEDKVRVRPSLSTD